MKTKNNYPALVTIRHKKSAGFTLSNIQSEASANATLENNRTTARAYTIIFSVPLYRYIYYDMHKL